MKISRGCKKETKRRQKASKEEENILSRSLALFTGQTGLPLSSSVVVLSSSSAVFVKHRAAREEKQESSTRTRKSRYLVERGSVVGRFIDREKCVCARVLPPYISLFSGLFSFDTFFFFFGGKTALLKPSFSRSDFFFLSFRKEKGTKRKCNIKKVRREYVERRRLSIYTALQKEGRIDLERFFLVENFQRRGERKFALRRVELREREREREKGILISFRREKRRLSVSVLLFFFIRTSLCARDEREKRGREGTWICVYAFELNRIQSHILVNRFFLGTKPSRLGVLRAIRCARVPFGDSHRAVPERCPCPLSRPLRTNRARGARMVEIFARKRMRLYASYRILTFLLLSFSMHSHRKCFY